MISTASPSATLSPAAPFPKAATTRIMVVDDHPLVRSGLMMLINAEPDLEVCAEANGLSQAMRAFRESSPNLVIVDVSLQNGSGLELVKELTAHEPDLKILVCSMHAESLFARRALRAGAKGYINKNEATARLIEAIRCVLNDRVYLSESMTDLLLCQNAGIKQQQKAADGPLVAGLSDRELEVFEQIGRGVTTRQVAEKLHLSPKTVETYRENIKAKLGLGNGSQLTREAIQWVLENC